jgi:hypothetical protein
VVALAGLEHGIGEVLQGDVAAAGPVIESWPRAEAFRALSGEPALTVVPNLLATGVLAILASCLVLVWATAFAHRRRGGPVLMFLAAAMLLLGGGIGPPLIGLGLGAAATRIGAPPAWWRTQPPSGALRAFAAGWPWFLTADVAAWLSLVPGVVLAGHVRGTDAVPVALVVALIAAAFAFLPLAVVAAFARDLPAAAEAPEATRSDGVRARDARVPGPAGS